MSTLSEHTGLTPLEKTNQRCFPTLKSSAVQVTVTPPASEAISAAVRAKSSLVPMGASFEHEIEPILVPLLNDTNSATGFAGPPPPGPGEFVIETLSASSRAAPDLGARASAVSNGSVSLTSSGSNTARGQSQLVTISEHNVGGGGRPSPLMSAVASASDVASAFGQRLDVVRQCTEYLFENKTSEARKVCKYEYSFGYFCLGVQVKYCIILQSDITL